MYSVKRIFTWLSVAVLGCIFSLVGITIYRYLAVTRPLKHKPWTKWTKIIIPAIWSTAILLPLKTWDEIGIVGTDSGNTVCNNAKTSIGLVIIMAPCFLLPFTVMLVLYANHLLPSVDMKDSWRSERPSSARKVTKMMIAVFLRLLGTSVYFRLDSPQRNRSRSFFTLPVNCFFSLRFSTAP